MDQTNELALVVAAGVGLLATMLILNRERREQHASTRESPFAISTEGEMLCPKCRMGNLASSTTCANCGAKLRG
jgi:hypothetical protein